MMLDKANRIINSIPLFETELFYQDLVGNTCNNGNGGCKYHIMAKLKLCHRWYRYNNIAHISNAITVYRIRVWLNHMSDKYNLNIQLSVPKIEG